MKFYIAGMFSRREEFKKYEEGLIRSGHESCAQWLRLETDMKLLDDEKRSQFAVMDAFDVIKSDVVISFTELPSAEGPGVGRGGRHVEFGIAQGVNLVVGMLLEQMMPQDLAGFVRLKKMYVVGPKENIFHFLPGTIYCKDFYKLYTDHILKMKP